MLLAEMNSSPMFSATWVFSIARLTPNADAMQTYKFLQCKSRHWGTMTGSIVPIKKLRF